MNIQPFLLYFAANQISLRNLIKLIDSGTFTRNKNQNCSGYLPEKSFLHSVIKVQVIYNIPDIISKKFTNAAMLTFLLVF